MHMVGKHLARKNADNCTCMCCCLFCPHFCLCCTVSWLKRCVWSFQNGRPRKLLPISVANYMYSVHPRIMHTNSKNSVEQRVAIAIWCLAMPCEYQTIGHLFGVARIPYVFYLWCIQNHCKDLATDTHPVSNWWWFTDYSYQFWSSLGHFSVSGSHWWLPYPHISTCR